MILPAFAPFVDTEVFVMGKNILIFGPNGSGKGTQGAILQKKFNIPHIETGAIFREQISGGTELGMKAKAFIDKGELVPDEITIPMMIVRLQQDDCTKGWILDGFPRSKTQAVALKEALDKEGIALDYVIELVVAREVAKERIMGRRLCVNDNNHPNHIAFDAIKPVEKDGRLVCRVCGGDLKTRADDQDEDAINKRHNIYYDDVTGTMAAVNYFKQLSGPKVISVTGRDSIQDVTDVILAAL